jgi:hypothetical protein
MDLDDWVEGVAPSTPRGRSTHPCA